MCVVHHGSREGFGLCHLSSISVHLLIIKGSDTLTITLSRIIALLQNCKVKMWIIKGYPLMMQVCGGLLGDELSAVLDGDACVGLGYWTAAEVV